jgi:hypothetical protein
MLRLLPGKGLRRRQHRQPDRFGEARGRRRHRADDADGEPRDPPFGPQRQLPRNLRAIESAQGRGDVRQQERRDRVAADQSHGARGQRQRYQLDQQHRIEHAGRHAAGPQGAQHRQPLLERQPDRRIDDEQPDHK